METYSTETAPLKRKKKISFYTEPYYIPGYTAYYSQLPFQIGDTYAHTTNKLLTDKTVSKSDRTVLVDTDKIEDPRKERESEKQQWLRRRNNSWGGIKYNERMVPGYSAYIPRSEEHFGAKYAEICERSFWDHNYALEKYDRKREEIESNMRQEMPPIRAEAERYVSARPIRHWTSPYFQDVDNPDKSYISGYTGYIPTAFGKFGLGYPVLTNEALVHFTKTQNGEKERAHQQVVIERPPRSRDISTIDVNIPIYTCTGLLPHYTGYLPGNKFRFGQTYGATSRYFHCERYFCKSKLPYVY